MMLFILFVILLALGIVLEVMFSEELWYILIFIAGIGAIICGTVLIVNQGCGRSSLIDYECDLQKFNIAAGNPNISEKERCEIIQMASSYNQSILKTKYWKNNFWIGKFYYAPTGDLPLFDLTKIPYARADVRADVKVDMR